MALSTPSDSTRSLLDTQVEQLKPVNRLLVVAQGGTGAAVVRALDRYLKANNSGFGEPLDGVQIEALVCDTDSAELTTLPEGVHSVLIEDRTVREMLRQRGLEDHVSMPGPSLDTSASGAQADPRNAMLRQVILLDRNDPGHNPVTALESIFREWKSPKARRLGERVNIAFVGGGHGGTGPGMPYLQVHARGTLQKVFGKSRAASIPFTRFIMSPESASVAIQDPVNGKRHWRNYGASIVKAIEADERQGLQIAPDRAWDHAGGPLSTLTFLVNSSNPDVSMDEHYEPANTIASSLIALALEGTSAGSEEEGGGSAGTGAHRNNAYPVRTANTFGPEVPITETSLPIFSVLGGARLRLSAEYKKAVFDTLTALFQAVVGLGSVVDEGRVKQDAEAASPATRISALRGEIKMPKIELGDFGDLERVPKEVETTVRDFTERVVGESVPGNVKQVLRGGVGGFVNGIRESILREKGSRGLNETIAFINELRSNILKLKTLAQESLLRAKEKKTEIEGHISARIAGLKGMKIPRQFGPFGKKEKEGVLARIQDELEGDNGIMQKCRVYADLTRDIKFFEILAAGEVRDGNVLDAVLPILDELKNQLNTEKLNAERILHEKEEKTIGRLGHGANLPVAFDLDFTPPFEPKALSETEIATLRQLLTSSGTVQAEWETKSMMDLWEDLVKRYMPNERVELLRIALREEVRDALIQRAGVLMVPAGGMAERQIQNQTSPINKTLVPVPDMTGCDSFTAAGYPSPVPVGTGGEFGIVQERHRIHPMQDTVSRRGIMALLSTPANEEDARALARRRPGEGFEALLNRGMFFTWRAEATDPGILQAFFKAVAEYQLSEGGGERHGEIRECENRNCQIPYYLSEPFLVAERKELEIRARRRGAGNMEAEMEAAFRGAGRGGEREVSSYDFCPGCRPIYGAPDAIVEEHD